MIKKSEFLRLNINYLEKIGREKINRPKCDVGYCQNVAEYKGFDYFNKNINSLSLDLGYDLYVCEFHRAKLRKDNK